MSTNILSNTGLKQLFVDEDVYFINNRFDGSTEGQNTKALKESKSALADESINGNSAQVIEKNETKGILHNPTEKAITKTVLIIVDKLTESGKSFLEKILGAVSLDFNKVDIKELEPGNSKTFGEYLIGNAGITKSIIFGIPLSNLGFKISMDNYTLQQLKHIQFLSIDKLAEIEADQALKRQLWTCLQEMFK